MILVAAVVKAGAAELDYKCYEECATARTDRLKSFDECVKNADELPDRLAAVKHKQFCRQRYPQMNCETLQPCGKNLPPVPQTPVPGEPEPPRNALVSLQNVSLAVLDPARGQKPGANLFYPGQTIWVRYDVAVGEVKTERLWFDQEIVIAEEGGREIFRDKDSFERPAGLTTAYNFKTSFHLPPDFAAGRYRMKLEVRERYSRWRETTSLPFLVGK